MHVDEDLAQAAALIFAGAQVNLVAAYRRLLRVTLAPLRQLIARGNVFIDNARGDQARQARLLALVVRRGGKRGAD